MSAETATTPGDVERGLGALSVGLWIALTAAVLQFTAVGSDFYQVGDNVRDAWFGIPHTTQLVLLSALTTVVLAGLAAAGRSPVRGRTAGVIIVVVGLLATAQLGYRMAVPPFQGCLTYNCGFTPNPNVDVTLLVGIWIALVGNIGATVGGAVHAASGAARRTPPNFWRARTQTGMTPWLGIAGLGAAGMFLVGFTFLPFYTVAMQDAEPQTWTAWLAIPHTAGLVLLLAAIIVGLVVAAGRDRAPMEPGPLGATIAVLAFVATVRAIYRIAVAPFYSGPAEGVFQAGADINLAAYVGVAFGVVAVVAGIVHAAQHRTIAAEAARRPVSDTA